MVFGGRNSSLMLEKEWCPWPGALSRNSRILQLRDHLVVEPAEVGLKLGGGCPCLAVVVVADCIDAFSTLEGMQRFGVADDGQLQLLSHCRAAKYDSDAVLQLLSLATFARVFGLYKRFALKLTVEEATLVNIEDILQIVAFADLWQSALVFFDGGSRNTSTFPLSVANLMLCHLLKESSQPVGAWNPSSPISMEYWFASAMSPGPVMM